MIGYSRRKACSELSYVPSEHGMGASGWRFDVKYETGVG